MKKLTMIVMTSFLYLSSVNAQSICNDAKILAVIANINNGQSSIDSLMKEVSKKMERLNVADISMEENSIRKSMYADFDTIRFKRVKLDDHIQDLTDIYLESLKCNKLVLETATLNTESIRKISDLIDRARITEELYMKKRN